VRVASPADKLGKKKLRSHLKLRAVSRSLPTALYTLITGVWMGFTIQIISAVFPATLIAAEFGKIIAPERRANKKAGAWLTLYILKQQPIAQ
jgi:hypothetical protein